ncbi:MAG: sulfurtransferase [Candidatus Methylomirabilales bacterium]
MNPPRKRWIWTCAGTVGLLLLATMVYTECWAEQAKTKGYANTSLLVSGQEVDDHLGEAGIRILDVRSPGRYAAGHIPGAVNLPIAEITRSINGVPGMLAHVEEVEQAVGRRGVNRGSTVVIYDDFGGNRATRLFWVLDYLDHPRVSVLDGGFGLWKQEGRRTSRDVPKVAIARYQGEPRPDRLADRTWVRSRLKDPSIVLVDARSPGEFDGKVPGRQVRRPGHIPGAVNVDWVRNLTRAEPRQFRAGAEMARAYRLTGVPPDKEVVVYCRTGMRASHTYFLLRLLGYPRVRLYDGSYVEWSADATLPVVR